MLIQIQYFYLIHQVDAPKGNAFTDFRFPAGLGSGKKRKVSFQEYWV